MIVARWANAFFSASRSRNAAGISAMVAVSGDVQVQMGAGRPRSKRSWSGRGQFVRSEILGGIAGVEISSRHGWENQDAGTYFRDFARPVAGSGARSIQPSGGLR